MRKLFTIDHAVNGRGPVQFRWNKGGNLLAVCGSSRQLCIFDRQGKPVDQKTLPHQGACQMMDWDASGETLAVMQQGSGTVLLWHNSGHKLEPLETGQKELTFMRWNRTGPHLAVGSQKGNLLLFNKKTLKKMTSMGKHSKKISCGCWSSDGKLALGGEDRAVTVSNTDGDLIDQTQLKVEPVDVQFARIKSENKHNTHAESTISANLDGKSLLLYQPGSGSDEQPTELQFQTKYGNIVSHRWFGDGYILIGFSSGHVVVISTHAKEIGQEISSIVPHNESLQDVTYCPALQKGASIGDSSVQVFDMTEITHLKAKDNDRYDLENEYGQLQRVEWTEDGQILTVSSKSGSVHTFLTKIPVLHDACDTRVLYLTSLRELCVRDVAKNADLAHISVEIEPTFLSLGPAHVAVGMNNCLWYYSLVSNAERDLASGSKVSKAPKVAKLVSQRSYVSSVEYVKLSVEHAAVMSDGKVTLHLIAHDEASEGSYAYEQDERKHQKVFPEKESADNKATCVAMTPKFMFYGTSQGSLVCFSLEDWTVVSDYRNTIGLRSIFPNATGTRVAYIDDTNEGAIYSPVDDSLCPIEGLGMESDQILWDTHEWGVFLAAEPRSFVTYVYTPHTRWGARCTPVAVSKDRAGGEMEKVTTDRPPGFKPILFRMGGVVCQMASNGTMPVIAVNTHTHLAPGLNLMGDQILQAFYNALGLNRLEQAWAFAKQLDSQDCWYALGDKALNVLDLQMAIRVYRVVQQPAMVLALDKLQHINEKALLLGHVSMLFKNFNDAQNHFMKSSNPLLALEMRRDLMNWDIALELAERLSKDSIPHISREYASQLEFRGELQQALDMYKRGLITLSGQESERKKRAVQQHNEQCHGGIARITIRTGDISRGFQTAMESDSRSMAIECAQIFEELRQHTEAAQLYEKAKEYDKAAQIYICLTKNMKAAAVLMPHITSHKIHKLYGAAKESEGAYEEAKQAFSRAQDWDSVVRLLVERLGDLSSAYEIVRSTKSAEAAAIVAKHCKKGGNPDTAIEFLLLAKKTEEAFELASSSGHMETYAAVLGSNGQQEDYLAVAQYYGQKNEFSKAGDFFLKCKKYDKALSRYLDAVRQIEGSIQRAEDSAETEKKIDENINKAIAVVGEAQSESLNKTLITYLTSEESDGASSSANYPKYLFSLYMALGKYEKGCGMAIVIARREQNNGHYRVAHRLLFQTYKQLEKHKVAIPSELRWNLMLLHSYLIVKPLMQILKDHETAARMLIRVSKNIPKFPQHVTAILTTCVTECNKAEFHKSAYRYAKELVTADRKEIPEKHRKKIDNIVRKPGCYSRDYDPSKRLTEADLTDPTEGVGPCPFCGASVPMTMLDCQRCRNNIPYCVVTGQHMLLEDWTACPGCNFPALYSVFTSLVSKGGVCPMCEEAAAIEKVRKLVNPDPKNWGQRQATAEPEAAGGGDDTPPPSTPVPLAQ